ncbi:DUF6894 family protein [Roseomonas chloroacetimidivorans]|uniref:DUF6894 family protein n=1 Tax=Roseomonas chloroacetimidivorans TaxID=1766656 RepID=UPI003C76818B
MAGSVGGLPPFAEIAVPRYHFHVRDGRTPPDSKGTELPDLMAARIEAARYGGELLVEHARTFWNEGEWVIEVTDSTGLTLFTLAFTAADAPVLRHREAMPPRP